MSEFVKTTAAVHAKEMCETVMAARDYSRIGQITGEPGTGKSAITYWLAEQFNAVRVECWHKMQEKTLMQELAQALNERGHSIDMSGTSNTLFQRMKACTHGQLIILDEANQLKWPVLELARNLSDIGGAGLILVGTDILAKRLVEARVRHYLAQLRQRIGAKRVQMEPMKEDRELLAYVIQPRFGAVTAKTARAFRTTCHGHWRSALELADACDRLMEMENIKTLNEAVIGTAGALMAGAEPPKRRDPARQGSQP